MMTRRILSLFAVGVLLGALAAGFNAAAYADEGSCPASYGSCTESCMPPFLYGGECEMVSCNEQNQCRYTQCNPCWENGCTGPDCAEV